MPGLIIGYHPPLSLRKQIATDLEAGDLSKLGTHFSHLINRPRQELLRFCGVEHGIYRELGPLLENQEYGLVIEAVKVAQFWGVSNSRMDLCAAAAMLARNEQERCKNWLRRISYSSDIVQILNVEVENQEALKPLLYFALSHDFSSQG